VGSLKCFRFYKRVKPGLFNHAPPTRQLMVRIGMPSRYGLARWLGSLWLVVVVVIALTPPLAVSQQDLETTVMLEKVRSAVVLIVTEVKGYIVWEEAIPTLRELGLPPIVEVSSIAFGSGFIVTPNGYIVTNGHVVNDYESELEKVRPLLNNYARTIAKAIEEARGERLSDQDIQGIFREVIAAYLTNKLKIQDYTVRAYVGAGRVVSGIGNIGKLYTARIVLSTPAEREDIAVLKIEINNAPSLKVSPQDVRIGDRVWALGYPGVVTFAEFLSAETLLEPTITSGVVSGYRLKVTGVNVMQSDVNVHHGNSGGPVVNSKGEVIAVTSFGAADPSDSGRAVPGFNFFVPASIVAELLRRVNVNSEESYTIKLYEEGLRLYYERKYSEAIKRFQTVKNLYPGFPFIDDYISNAQAAILRGEEASTINPVVVAAAVALVVIAAGGGVGFVLLRRRSKPQPYTPQTPYQPPPRQPASPVEELRTADYRVRVPPGYSFCINCGKLIPSNSVKCPYCGAEQESA